MKNIKQKKLLIIILVLIIISIILISKYTINNNYINKYKNNIYEPSLAKKLLFLNIQEKYIAHYNYGTSLYQTEDYKNAKKEFNKALKTTPKKRICYVRANLALTEIKLLPEKEDIDILIKKIENIENILLENDCATTNNNGKDKKSQEIYDYLEQIKNELKQEQGQGGEGSEGEEEPNEGEEVIENETDKIDKIKSKDREAASGRNPSREQEYNENNYNEAVW